jgi:zinc D-Ala-D-Ala carboxypeptidase
VRGWIIAGLGVLSVTFTSGAAWSLTTWGELVVVAPESDSLPAAPPGLSSLATPTTTTPTTTAAPATTAPACTIGDQPVSSDPLTDWATVLVDATYGLTADFEPPDLVDVSAAGFRSDDQVREVVIPDLNALREAATANGTPLEMVSAYRSYAYQQSLFSSQVDKVGEAEAQRTSARPGHSEHQLGTTVDLTAPDTPDLASSFAQTPTGQWLAANAHTYGFVLSYPDVSQDRSCYGFEPWHLRYVGLDTATKVHDSGLILREWQYANRPPAA